MLRIWIKIVRLWIEFQAFANSDPDPTKTQQNATTTKLKLFFKNGEHFFWNLKLLKNFKQKQVLYSCTIL